MQALELFSLLTVKIVLSQAKANLWQELASQPAQDTEKLQDHLESAYSNGMIMYLLFTSIPFRNKNLKEVKSVHNNVYIVACVYIYIYSCFSWE